MKKGLLILVKVLKFSEATYEVMYKGKKFEYVVFFNSQFNCQKDYIQTIQYQDNNKIITNPRSGIRSQEPDGKVTK